MLDDLRTASASVEPSTWRCPACLAPSPPGAERCEHCRCSLVLAERFVIVEPLASQGPARTLAGIDRHEGTPVVVKTLSVSGLDDWKQLELFQRGIGVLRGLAHPGIPAHLADGELTRGGETLYFWVQGRIEGRTLAEGLAAGQRWTEARARTMADAILEVLEYLQSFSPPILHRDIKPSNIMERTDGGWVLIDFDLVKDTLDPEGGATVALGTAGYAPLEQLMGRAGPASDLYGLGATLVALLCRKSPADLLDPEHGGVAFRGHMRVSEGFGDFIGSLLEPRVDRRPADARAARARLRVVDDAGGTEAPAPARSTRDPRPDASDSPRAEARRRLLRLMIARARDLTPPVVASPEERHVTTLEAVEPGGSPMVRIEPALVERHAPPWWERAVRLAMVAAAGLWVPASGAVLLVVIGVVWVVSGLVVRYPVQLAPGRALYMGGLSNTGEPGRYWLRRRWFGNAYSIPQDTLHIDWRLAPTRIEGAAHPVWLELRLEVSVRPRSDDAGQFTALMKYSLWHEHRTTLAKQLRKEVVGALTEHLDRARVLERVAGEPMAVEAQDLLPPLDEGLGRLGLERVVMGRHEGWLVPRTEDLSSEDWVRVTRASPPEDLPPGDAAEAREADAREG